MTVIRRLLGTLVLLCIATGPGPGDAAGTRAAGGEDGPRKADTAAIPAATLFRNPTISQPKLSPDGRHIAFVFSKDDAQRLFVRKVDGVETVGLAEFQLEKARLNWFEWASSSRILLSDRAPGPDEVGIQPLVTRFYGVNLKRPKIKWLGKDWGPRGPDWPITQARFPDHVVSMMRSDRDSVVISHVEFGQRTPSVSKLNVVSGRLRRIEGPRSGLERWHVDEKGLVRAAEVFGASADQKSYTLLARIDPDRDLEPVLETPDADRKGYEFAGFHVSPERFYVIADHDGRRAIFEFDVRARQLGKVVFAHDTFDVDALYADPTRGEYVGATYIADQPELEFFDDAASKQQASIDLSLANSRGERTRNRIVSATGDGKLSIIEVASEAQPPVYFALDRENKTMNFIFEEFPDLPVARLRHSEAIEIKARDGVALPAYLTRPALATDRRLPLLVMLHAGRGARAALVYDPAVQFFASRGYAVLRVNHRGSGGYGRAFSLAGLDATRVMNQVQDDLADAVRWAVDAGIADSDRVAILGAGGSGATAVLAVAQSPTLFRAAASYGGDMRFGASSLRGLKAPVLLAHGGRNTDVPIDGARAFAKAAAASGATVEWLEYPEETRGFVLERNRIDYYERLLAFFDEHLKPRVDAGGGLANVPAR